MLSRQKHLLLHPFTVAVIVLCFAIAGSATLKSQSWTPAGQMVGPLMWEFPLSLPDGTHLIPLRWVNGRNNDSLYWFDIKSFITTPKKYERQTLNFKQISDINDFDSDGRMDLWGGNYGGGGLTIFGVFSETERTRPHQTGIIYPNSNVNTRYFGDIDGDGLNDDFAAEGESSVRIVYGDRVNPFVSPSYVELHDNSQEQYPDLAPTTVAAVGVLGGKPCIVQVYQVLPEMPPYYELHELYIDDLKSRAAKIRTRLVQKFKVGEIRRYGHVVLRTPEIWWLFSSSGSDSNLNGLRITQTQISLEPVPVYWRGGYQQFFGQGGHRGDDNFPRVLDHDAPFVKETFQTRYVEGVGDVRHSVFELARLTDPQKANVEVIGRGVPPDSQCIGTALLNTAVIPDMDGDSVNDFMVCYSYTVAAPLLRQNSVSLYLTTSRPVVSVESNIAYSDAHIIDNGETWRIIRNLECLKEPETTAVIFDLNGGVVATVSVVVSGTDLILEKPKSLSRQVLWLRLGSCTLRLP